MSDAQHLLQDLLSVIPSGHKASAFFADDGVLELPFLHSVGMPTRYQGRTQIRDFYEGIRSIFPDFEFKPHDTRILITTPNQVFAEYMAHTTAAGTGRLVHHLFAGRLVAEGGKIKLLRESLNVAAAAQSLNPKGAADLPPPGVEVFSVPPGYAS